MPDEIPDEVKKQIGETAVVAEAPEDDPFAALAGLNEEITPPVEEEVAPAEEPAEVATDAQPVSHPPELIERATVLMIPADEVAEMSTAELRRVIKHADRIGQAVNDYHASKPADKPVDKPVDKPQEPDLLAVFDDEEKVHPDLAKYLKPVLAKVLDDNKALREETAKLKAATATSHQQVLHSRLMAQAPEVASKFDLASKAGQAKYQELLAKMGIDQQYNSSLSEKQLLQRAIKAMDLVPEKPKEAPETTVAKKRWNENALAQPNSRKGKESLEDIVGKIMREDAQKSKRTNGQAAKLPQ